MLARPAEASPAAHPSGLARFSPPFTAAYAAVKGAVEALTRYQANALGARGIAVNTVAPGAIETDFRGGAVRDKPEIKKVIASQAALGRIGLPDAIGGVIASPLSPASGSKFPVACLSDRAGSQTAAA